MFTKSDIADIYPLSPMQESMLLHCRLHPESRATYFEQRSYRITGPLNIRYLKEAFNSLVERHASLRTIFVAEKSKRPLQIVLKPRAIPWQQESISSINSTEQSQAVDDIRSRDLEKGLDCTRELPIRITLIILGESCFELIWSMHHIVVDGWSTGMLYSELMERYRSAVAGAPPQLPGLVPYSRYITWLEKHDQQESLGFWHQELNGVQNETVLPGQIKCQHKKPYVADSVCLTLDPESGAELRKIAARWQVTVSTMVHTIWGILLGWYNDSDDVVFGSVVSGRPESLAGSDRMIGLCINTIPVRMQFREGMSIRELALTLQERSLAASDHHFSNLAEVQNTTSAKHKLINHIVAMENFPRVSSEQIEGVTIQPTASHEQINYDLALVVVPHNPFEVELHYNRSVYDAAAVNTIAGHLVTLVKNIVRNPELKIEKCDPLSAEDCEILDSLNNTTQLFDTNVTPVALFEQQVRKYPADLAVTDDEGSLDYQQLAKLVDRIAGYLYSQSSYVPGMCVGVMIERSRWIPASLFGIMKAGGTYVPLDPQTPTQRVAAILKDCGCKIVLTLPHLQGSIPWDSNITVIDVTRIDESFHLSESVRLPQESAAYLIYTSGSTGTPKGVAVSTRSVMNFAAWVRRYYELGRSTRSTLFASPAFDASILELIPVLLSGGSLHCLRDTFIDGEDLITFFREHDISLSFISTVLCEEICRIHAGRLRPDFKIITGADVLRYAGDGSIRVFNNYGPTEGTVVATAAEVTGLGNEENMPIGFPIDNTEIYVFDHYGRRSAYGAVGELFIGGAGLAQGYVGLEKLTRECFLPHPEREGERVYRTGDRVRIGRKSGLEFLGRIDTQIQIRGYRIEPLEIETSLRKHPMVQSSVAIVREEPTGAVLVAFLVPESAQQVSTDALRSFLRQILPEYMIPTRFVWVERFPLTESGKVDRDRLRETLLPEEIISADDNTLQAHSPVEEKLVEIWRDVIGVECISSNDNFFSLGGHSLSATRMASRIRREMSVELSLRVIFDTPVLAELAKHIETLTQANTDAVSENNPA